MVGWIIPGIDQKAVSQIIKRMKEKTMSSLTTPWSERQINLVESSPDLSNTVLASRINSKLRDKEYPKTTQEVRAYRETNGLIVKLNERFASNGGNPVSEEPDRWKRWSALYKGQRYEDDPAAIEANKLGRLPKPFDISRSATGTSFDRMSI
jgi:hypothetical protein